MRLTPIQQAIHWFQTEPEAIGRWNTDDIIKMLKPFLPAEQSLFEEIWRTATTTCMESGGPADGFLWTKETFLNQFKPEQ